MVPSDLERFLDPSYTPYKLSPPSNYLTLVVDHKGDFHDPDYRHFPVSVRPSSPIRTRYQSHSPIPFYEDDDEQEDTVEDEISIFYPERATKRNSPRHSPRSLLSSPASSYSAFSQSSPSSSATPLEDSYSFTSSPRRLQRHRPLPPISYDDEHSALFATPPHPENHFGTEPEIPPAQVRSTRSLTPVPTCMNALRMQWYSVSLSVRFRVFRTKRSLRRKIFRQDAGNT